MNSSTSRYEPYDPSQALMPSLWLLIYFRSLNNDKSVESALQIFAVHELQEAVEEINEFNLEKHSKETAAAVKATEEESMLR